MDWKYTIIPPVRALPLRTLPPVEEGARGVMWALAEDGECYGVNALILNARPGMSTVDIQTEIPLGSLFRDDVVMWALVDDSGVIVHGP